ncbi:GntR family transcriptional regulator [Actinoplanes sp. NBRC 101535]|uniref:GntR family transcriptional regulator n=1 Tax=Actinoplanes sp. NBRC 101535 TaxID=3032196 RepID=UPI0024A3E004|nr:GntR family transcriptional regulator [Actinoplanes sp. NBRC 101535]GLX99807.1 GntR family transcriptional regulator [Actinoplanes sp. NBRC 101535]
MAADKNLTGVRRSRPRRDDRTADKGTTRDAIRAAILAGEFTPGERLVEALLIERFDASRFNVRLALQDLAGEGLVEIQRNRGAQVRKISLSETIEITQVRMVLEGLVAAQAAERVTDDGASELDEIGLLMRRAVEAGEYRRYSDLNQRLHGLIRRIADHHTADRLISTLHAQLARHQFMLSLLPGRPQASLPQHERIIDAIRRRDPVAAELAMREHIASVVEVLRTLDDQAVPHL